MEENEELYHFGILGQKWGLRRYQNSDGTLTDAGKKRYGILNSREKLYENTKKSIKTINSMRKKSANTRNVIADLESLKRKESNKKLTDRRLKKIIKIDEKLTTLKKQNEESKKIIDKATNYLSANKDISISYVRKLSSSKSHMSKYDAITTKNNKRTNSKEDTRITKSKDIFGAIKNTYLAINYGPDAAILTTGYGMYAGKILNKYAKTSARVTGLGQKLANGATAFELKRAATFFIVDMSPMTLASIGVTAAAKTASYGLDRARLHSADK